MKKSLLFLSFFAVVFLIGVATPVHAQVCKPKCEANETQSGTCGNGEPRCVAKAPAANAGSATSVTISNPLKYDTVEGFVASVMAAIQNIVVVLAILAIVIGGVLYVVSAGNSGLMTTAKGAITGALIGLAIVIAAPSFLKEVYTLVGGKDDPAELKAALSLTQIATNTLEFLLSIVGIIAIIMLIIGGMAYLTSGGDSKRADVGKEIVKNALIGIAIVMGALVIVRAVAGLLMGNASI